MTIQIEAAARLKAADATKDASILKELSAMIATKMQLNDIPKLSYRMASPGKLMIRGFGSEAVQTQKRMDQYGDHYKFKLADMQAFLEKHGAKPFKR